MIISCGSKSEKKEEEKKVDTLIAYENNNTWQLEYEKDNFGGTDSSKCCIATHFKANIFEISTHSYKTVDGTVKVYDDLMYFILNLEQQQSGGIGISYDDNEYVRVYYKVGDKNEKRMLFYGTLYNCGNGYKDPAPSILKRFCKGDKVQIYLSADYGPARFVLSTKGLKELIQK